jgi:hypothetical protein
MRLSLGLFLLLTAIVANIVLSVRVTWDDIVRDLGLGDDPYLDITNEDVGINIITTALKLRYGINETIQSMDLNNPDRPEVEFRTLLQFFRTARSLVGMIDPKRGEKMPFLYQFHTIPIRDYVNNILDNRLLRGSWLCFCLSQNILTALLYLLDENPVIAQESISATLWTCENIDICQDKLERERREEVEAAEAAKERKRARARRLRNAISAPIPCWNCPRT